MIVTWGKGLLSKTATLKQKRAFKIAVENGGSVSAAMRDAGYSPETAKNPSKLTESEQWLKMLDKYIPDDLLNTKLVEGLDSNKQLATRVIFKKDAPTSQSARELPAATGMTDDFIEVPDMQTRHKYLETAYKLKGRLNKNEGALNIDGQNIQINVVGGGYVPQSSPANGSPTGSDL